MQKTNDYFKTIIKCIGFGSLILTTNVIADGLTIDKVYHPYVQPLERELEFRWLHYDDDKTNSNHVYRLGIGQSFTTNWFVEAYVIGQNNADDSGIEAYELEAKWQLTEQGEYNADWGLLFEIEKETKQSIWEAATTLLIEREWDRLVGTANLALAFETGDNIDTELETSLAMQLRYRYSRALEPALEFYMSENTLGLGPVLMGEQRFETRKKLHWELGIIAGLSDETPDATLRALAEFEF